MRISTAVLHEIVRTRKRGLGFSGHCATHDFQILAAGGVIDRCDISYVVGLEMRGLSPKRPPSASKAARCAPPSGATPAWAGVTRPPPWACPSCRRASCLARIRQRTAPRARSPVPSPDQTYLAIPALFPDVGIIHVHQADRYGNAQIEGISIVDVDLARASKRLILTAERIVDTENSAGDPARPAIPYWLVDAVCLVPYGSYPGEMPYEYTSDEAAHCRVDRGRERPEHSRGFLEQVYLQHPGL